MSIGAVVASSCCCGGSPCPCATTAFSLGWTGGLTLKAECDGCGDPEDGWVYTAGVVSVPSGLVAVLDIGTCFWQADYEQTVAVLRCDGEPVKLYAGVFVRFTIAKSILSPFKWQIEGQFFHRRANNDLWPIANIVWQTDDSPGSDCPPTGSAFAHIAGTITPSPSLCWIAGDMPIESWTPGTITLT